MCSAPAFAIWLLSVAIVLSIVAVSLSSWSTSARQGNDLTAGVWGFCVDVTRSATSNSTEAPPPPGTVTKCFPFHTASDGVVVNQTLYVVAMDSVCSLDRSGQMFRNLLALTPNPIDMRLYIEQSCGSLGWASLILAAMVPGLAAIALVLLAWFYFTEYYRTRYNLLVAAAVFTTFAFVSSIASFILWSIQTPVVATFAGAYWVELAAAVVLLIAVPVTILACRKLVDINQPHLYENGRRDATMGTYEHHLASPRDNTVEVK